MAKKTDRARMAGVPVRKHETPHGESQRESSGRLAAARVANVQRYVTKKQHLELDPKTKRPKR
jgi:hypothetical protein